jgi:hypothetical protein
MHPLVITPFSYLLFTTFNLHHLCRCGGRRVPRMCVCVAGYLAEQHSMSLGLLSFKLVALAHVSE